MTKFYLYDEQTINELKKNAWASISVFCLKRLYLYIHIYVYVYVHVYVYLYKYYIVSQKAKLVENNNFCLFAANGKRNRKWKFAFLGLQTINGNQHLLCQQTCPSLHIWNLRSKVWSTLGTQTKRWRDLSNWRSAR